MLKLAGEGANVVVNARSNRQEAEAVAREARDLGVEAVPILADVGKKTEVEALAAKALSEFGFLVSAVVTPFVGRLMDRRGPLLVIEFGVVAMTAGLLLATLARTPWQLYLSLGALVGGGVNCLAYTGQSLYLTRWFVRRRGLALSIAFSGVGLGSVTLLPWLQSVIENSGWRAACWALCILVFVLLAPPNLLLRRRPEDIGLVPDGIQAASAGSDRSGNIVDTRWAAVDWTLPRALGTARFWWIALGYFCGLFAWYAVQVHQTKYLIDIGFSPNTAAWALGAVSLVAVPGQIALGHLSDRIGREWVWTIGNAGFVLCCVALVMLRDSPMTALRYFMVITQGMLGYGLTSVMGAIPPAASATPLFEPLPTAAAAAPTPEPPRPFPMASQTNPFGMPVPISADHHHDQQQEDYLWGV